jgi:transposase-like protein
MRYPQEVKESVVRSALSGEMTQDGIAERYGVSRSAVQQWLRQARERTGAPMTASPPEKRPQDWSAEERFAAILESQAMNEQEMGVWCRRHGLHSHQLAQWRRDAIAGSRGDSASREQAEVRRLRQENAEIKRDLARKDKALEPLEVLARDGLVAQRLQGFAHAAQCGRGRGRRGGGRHRLGAKYWHLGSPPDVRAASTAHYSRRPLRRCFFASSFRQQEMLPPPVGRCAVPGRKLKRVERFQISLKISFRSSPKGMQRGGFVWRIGK